MNKNKGIYLLPNSLTILSLFCGYQSIVYSIHQEYSWACLAIIAGLFFDGLDGRIARLTNSQTHFGSQLDSLSDLITFGLAPSILCYLYSLSSLNKIGYLIGFVLTATTAIRLARFNSRQGLVDKRFFEGLPCPASGCLLSTLIWLLETKTELKMFFDSRLVIILLVLMCSIAMVSSIPYPSFKDIDESKTKRIGLLVVICGLVFFAMDPIPAMFSLLFGYLIICPLSFIVKKIRKNTQSKL